MKNNVTTTTYTFTLLFFLCLANLYSQKKDIPQSIKASIGLGISAPYEDYDIDGSGFYAQGEYTFKLRKWIDLKPYLGFITTSTSTRSSQNFKVASTAIMFGGKARFKAPLPWVAPFVEFGAGGSIGSFLTFIPTVNLEEKGILFHIPISLGLEIGKNHDTEIAFLYYFHEKVRQFNGAVAIGLNFPISKNK